MTTEPEQVSAQSLLVTEERLALALAGGGGVGTWDWDIAADRIYSNASFAELFSLDAKMAASGVPVADFTAGIHPDDQGVVLNEINKALEIGGEYATEYRVVSKAGGVRWVYSCGRCHLDDAGVAVRFPGVVFDITARKQAEQMLEEKARLAALTAEVSIALAEVATLPAALQRCAQSIVNHLDAAFARIWTLNAAEGVLELQASAGLYTHLNGVHGRVRVGSLNIGLIAEERKPHLTNDVLHDPRVSDPEWARREGMVAFAGYPLIVDGGLAGVMALFSRHLLAHDTLRGLEAVSTTVAIGIERKRAEAALKESEARYRFLAESMPQMVWTATPDGALDYVSGQAGTYFGVASESLVGEGWVMGVHAEDRDAVLARWLLSLETYEPYEVEFRLKRGGDSAWRWFLARARHMPATGKWVGTTTDIHEQKSNQEALTKANRELEEFAYVASHDLQEPLRMVNIYTQLLLRRLNTDDAALNQYAQFVHQGVDRMEQLLRDLLTFSRSVHREAPSFGTADLGAAVEEALSVLQSRIEETGAIIKVEPMPTTRGETLQLAHVFQNLISNSLKYRKDGRPEIAIRAEREGESWTISVEDDGIGFDPVYAEQIFGLFKRLHKDAYPGTGLGLAICQRIVERYGGRMWAESKLGEGSVFRFSLPRAEETQAS